MVHLRPLPVIEVHIMFQNSGNVLLDFGNRICSLENLSVQPSGEVLSLKEDLAPSETSKPRSGSFSRTYRRFGKLVPCLARFLWAEQGKKASELREHVCVLVSLLVGLGVLDKLVRSRLTGCSLCCLLVF